MSFLSHKCSSNHFVLKCGLCTYFAIITMVPLTVTKLGRHIDVIIVRHVIPHIAGIVVVYWRNGCSYRNLARKVGLHSNTVYDIIKRFRECGNFVCGRRTRRPRNNTVYDIIKRFRECGNFVCGKRTRRPRKTNDRDNRGLYRLIGVNRRLIVQRLRRAWQPNVICFQFPAKR